MICIANDSNHLTSVAHMGSSPLGSIMQFNCKIGTQISTYAIDHIKDDDGFGFQSVYIKKFNHHEALCCSRIFGPA